MLALFSVFFTTPAYFLLVPPLFYLTLLVAALIVASTAVSKITFAKILFTFLATVVPIIALSFTITSASIIVAAPAC